MLVYGCPKLKMLFTNKKIDLRIPVLVLMKQNYNIFSNQLVHIWHEVIQNVNAVPNMHGMGQTGGSFMITN